MDIRTDEGWLTMTTKEKIKQIGFDLFAEKGYSDTSMNEIAEAVGIKKASMYAHFIGKEELFLAIYQDLTHEFDTRMDEVSAEIKNLPFEALIYASYSRYIEYFLENRKRIDFFYQLLYFKPEKLYHQLESHVASYQKRYQGQLEQVFEEGIAKGVLRPGNAHEMAMSFRCFREGILFMTLLNIGLKHDQKEQMWNHYWHGIRNPDAR